MSEALMETWDRVKLPPRPALQSVTVDPKKTAFFLLDFLHEVCTPEFSKGTGAELAEALQPIDGERIYSAPFDKFHGNDLESYVRGRGVDTIILTGTSPNGCLLFTTAGALLRGFRAIVPIDGMPAKTLYQEQFVAWQIANGPGQFSKAATLTTLADITFRS